MLERTNLQKAWHEASMNYARALEADAAFQDSLSVAQAVFKQDHLAEDAVQVIMRCQYALGQRQKAVESYQAFAKHLDAELAIAPLEQTRALAESIRIASLTITEKPTAEKQAHPQTLRTTNKLRNLPTERSSFIGRETLLADISQFLEEGCRLITLVGSGGMGKTRLAMKVMLEHAQQFADGAVFVPLDTAHNTAEMAQQILTVLDIQQTDDAPNQQIIDNLKHQNLLLILDNLEQIPDAADLIHLMLENAPSISMLATSRQILGLQAEQIVEVGGMAIPQKQDADSEQLESVQLFLRAARRVASKFRLNADNQTAVYQICQQVDGSPLALELAANWAQTAFSG